MNFIIELFSLKNYNAIFVYMNYFIKIIHFYFIIINITIKKFIKLYLKHIFKYYKLLKNIIINYNI